MFKKSFLTGLAILSPIAITVWIINFFFDLLTKPFMFVAQAIIQDFGLLPDDHPFWLFLARISILVLLFVICIIAGYIGQKIFFSYLIEKFKNFLKKIPVVNTLYKVIEQTVDSFLNEKKNPFNHVVFLNFPGKDSKTIGFWTGKTPKKILEKDPDATEAVFVPTAPHPISGFLLFFPKDQIRHVELTGEDAFKILLSCGSYNPDDESKS